MVGNLTRDPDYKQNNSGQGICRLSLASSRQFRNKQTNALMQEVCYIDVDVWGAQAETCRQYLQKGRPVLVEGRLKLDTWEAEGQTKRKHYIVADRVLFLSSNAQSETAQDETMGASAATPPKADYAVKARKATSPSADLFGADAPADSLFKDEPPFEDDLPF